MSNRKVQKAIPFIQVWLGVVLVILALAVSFLPIVKLQTKDNGEKIANILSELELSDAEVPEYVEVSTLDLVKSAKILVDFVLYNIDDEKFAAKGDALRASLETPEGKETFATAISIFAATADIFADEDTKDGAGLTEEESNNRAEKKDSNIMSVIFDVIIVFGAILGVYGITVVMPLAFAIIALKSLITALIHIKHPTKAVAKVGGTLSGTFKTIFVLMILQSLLPGMSFGTGVIALLAIAAGSAVMNTVISRVRRYTREEMKYLNIVQGVSAVGIVGFLLYFFNFLKTNIFVNFIDGTYTAYIGKVLGIKTLAAVSNVQVDINNSYLIDGIIVMLLITVVMISISYFISCVERFSCTRDGGDFLLIGAIISAFAFALPTYLINAKHAYNDPTSTAAVGDRSFLELSGAENDALTLVLVGVIVMLVAEIALIVLKAVFCKKLSKADRRAVISGSKFLVEETPKAPVVEETVAEEPVVEETVIEEPVAEETATEEPVVEETVAEEPVVEETATEEPVVEETATEEPVVEETATEEPVVEETAAEEPVVEETATEEPVVEETAIEEPVVEETATEEPVAEEAAK